MEGAMKRILAGCVVAAGLAAGPAYPHGETVEQQLGNVHFQVSCSPAAQQKFHRAVALYHSFDWNRGWAAFEEIAKLDPKCAMAHWGLAMIATDNPFGWPISMQPRLRVGTEAIARARELGASTRRERDYIEALSVLYRDHESVPHRPPALAYENAMERLAAAYPADAEAKILYSLAVSANHDLNDKTYARPLKAAALLEPLFRAYPRHPGVAHYLIHSYDYPPIAAKGLEAAKRYAGIAPDAAHAQHMPSHIFTRVGFWRESIASNQASADTEKGREFRQTPHAWDYMMYAYLQLGEDAQAARLLQEALGKPLGKSPSFGEVFAYSALPARFALERGRWSEAASLARIPGLEESDWKRFPHAESLHAYARALGAARSGDAAAARKEIGRLREISALLIERKLDYWAEQSDIQGMVATAWALRAEGKSAEALALMRSAADREDQTEKHVVVPGPLVPSRELLGDMLLEMGQAAEALAQYEAAIGREPNRFRGLYGAAQAAERAGDGARARLHYEKLAAVCAQSDTSRAELVRARQIAAR
jgi:tetratricopeptide (TPR) repeat protein